MLDAPDPIEEWFQRTLRGTERAEEEVMLELTVPMSQDTESFRVGWSLKAVRSRRWIAISTGRAEFSRQDLARAAHRMESILDAMAMLVTGVESDGRAHRR